MPSNSSSDRANSRPLLLSDPAEWANLKALKDSPVWATFSRLLLSERAEQLESLRDVDTRDAAAAVLDWIDDVLSRLEIARIMNTPRENDPTLHGPKGNPYIEASSD